MVIVKLELVSRPQGPSNDRHGAIRRSIRDEHLSIVSCHVPSHEVPGARLIIIVHLFVSKDLIADPSSVIIASPVFVPQIACFLSCKPGELLRCCVWLIALLRLTTQ